MVQDSSSDDPLMVKLWGRYADSITEGDLGTTWQLTNLEVDVDRKTSKTALKTLDGLSSAKVNN